MDTSIRSSSSATDRTRPITRTYPSAQVRYVLHCMRARRHSSTFVSIAHVVPIGTIASRRIKRPGVDSTSAPLLTTLGRRRTIVDVDQPRRAATWSIEVGFCPLTAETRPASTSLRSGGTARRSLLLRGAESPTMTVRSGTPKGAWNSRSANNPASFPGSCFATHLATASSSRSRSGANRFPGR